MKVLRFIFLVLFIFISFRYNSFSQIISSDTTLKLFDRALRSDKKRTHLLNYTIGGTYALSMTWLYTQWYKDYPLSSFHFFNDDKEWLQMDKGGHLWNTYNIAKPLTRLYQWAGHDRKKATLYGTGIALLFQTTVEVFDGFSDEWGFSVGDFGYNILGAGIFAEQELLWKEQKIVLKYSFHKTEYSKYRKDVLGSNLPENILKDYNGLTYWVCANPAALFSLDKFPKWLSLAVGYGAEGMTGGTTNPTEVDGVPIPSFERYRQLYISIDFDLHRIETKSRFLRSVFDLINIVRLPAPAIEFAKGRKPVYYGFYF